ncbi:MAG: glutamate--tRNA ligase [Candidatus Aminicenantes bacterium]|nr:glutamate--tRNA ligase [Candidatus Aminicenantes bacterium]
MVTVRFAPSPTGFLHLGSARTALFNWLHARHTGGRFLLRVEDTDRVRSDPRFLEEILSDLRWLGLDWDGEPLFQSRRFPLYRQKAGDLVAAGRAYREGEAVLFRIEKGRTIEYDDIVHGRIAVRTDDIKDQVLIKSDGSPSYNFACVVDDAEMGITDILRGDDHISNTPKQILFYEAFGLAPPRFGHMPLILGPDGAKLSKRHGGVSVEEYRKEGYLPGALVNHLILLGWYPGEEHEVMTLEEAARMFEISHMGDVQAKFDLQKLRWLNAAHIMKKTAADLLPLVKDQLAAAGVSLAGVADEFLLKLIDLYKIRMKTLREFPEMTDCFFRDDYAVEEGGKRKYLESPESVENLRLLAARLEGLAPFSAASVEDVFRKMAEDRNLKPAALIHPARMAVSGRTSGAGLFEMMELLGKEKVLTRLRGTAL